MIQKLKPINQQVIFITGATSSVGITTIRLALNKGARVYMVGDNEDQLQEIQDEMRFKNLPTAYAVANVAEFDQLELAVDHCLDTFGTIDTWINNAALPFDPQLLDTSEEEYKRLFDINFWGLVNLCKLAQPIMESTGGSMISVGTVLIQQKNYGRGMYLSVMNAVKIYLTYFRKHLFLQKKPASFNFIVPHPNDLSDLVAAKILRCATPLKLCWREIFLGRFKALSLPSFHHR